MGEKKNKIKVNKFYIIFVHYGKTLHNKQRGKKYEQEHTMSLKKSIQASVSGQTKYVLVRKFLFLFPVEGTNSAKRKFWKRDASRTNPTILKCMTKYRKLVIVGPLAIPAFWNV